MGSLRKLIEDVHGSPIDDKAFNTFRDYLVLFRLPAIIRQVKDEFKIDTEVFYYTKQCTKQKQTTTVLPERTYALRLRPSRKATAVEKSDVNLIDAAIVFSQTAGRSEQSDKTKTGKRRRSTVEKGM
ncbi:hypothetical protein G6F70_006837 [Rhizopus microsporus]|nr:hypothetical protein G6F71_005537 [Rhizopus microsporus]KAG1197172.1 hypothetical protein G6F70_006837 [Rhizopus microsporus]KAG1210997.1 hypothetical protein G6F69_004985 [Rhizopus microsporus]KAG1235156.1 hypothetical protein G6F67_002979 [Rhizopus microsporus]KAG1262479.1 hypothetical protein G6F68_005897 [Rhizopus microsporus]